jgi:hypothetical protein
VALGAGILFLLIVIVGGGFAIRRIVIPKVSNWARVASGIVGLLLVLPFMLTALGGYGGRDAASQARMVGNRTPWSEVGSRSTPSRQLAATRLD